MIKSGTVDPVTLKINGLAQVFSTQRPTQLVSIFLDMILILKFYSNIPGPSLLKVKLGGIGKGQTWSHMCIHNCGATNSQDQVVFQLSFKAALTRSKHQRRNSLGNERQKKSFIAISCPQHSFKSISKPNLSFGTQNPPPPTHRDQQQLLRGKQGPWDKMRRCEMFYITANVQQAGAECWAWLMLTWLWSGQMPQGHITCLSPTTSSFHPSFLTSLPTLLP